MKSIVRLAAAFLLCTAAVGTVSAADFTFEPLRFPSSRTGALGGMHAALADDLTVLISNPAGFRSAGPQFAVAEITANLSGPIFSLADLAFRIVGGANPATLLAEPDVQALFTSLYTGATINGPLALGYIGNGLGFGLFNSTSAVLSTQGTVPTVTSEVREDLLFVAGYGFRIPLPDRLQSTLDLGFSVKAFARTSIDWSESILSFFSLLTSPGTALGQPFTVDVGFGLDAGALYAWNHLLSVGLVARNLYSPVARTSYTTVSDFSAGIGGTKSYGSAPMDLALGLLYTPKLGFLEEYLSSPKVMLDYSDMVDFWTHPATASNPLLHLGLGVEVILLDALALRAGFGDGYFSAGFGMNLTVFKLDLTMFGRELSLEPGLRPNYNLVVSLLFQY
jgi:hypothetical protein